MTRWASVSEPKQVTIVLFSNKEKTSEVTRRASEVTHPVKRNLKLAWRDEPAVKLEQAELDHSFMQIAVLLLEPEDS